MGYKLEISKAKSENQRLLKSKIRLCSPVVTGVFCPLRLYLGIVEKYIIINIVVIILLLFVSLLLLFIRKLYRKSGNFVK